MRPGVFIVGLDCGKRRALSQRRRTRDISPAQVNAEHVAGSQNRMRLTVVCIDRNRLFQKLLRD